MEVYTGINLYPWNFPIKTTLLYYPHLGLGYITHKGIPFL